MKCRKCKKNSAKYNDRGFKYENPGSKEFTIKKRTDFMARCRKCGWEGVIKNGI